MAAQGAMAEAEAAFELAAQIPVKGGLYLHEVLALRDLKVLVLDKDGRGVYMHVTHRAERDSGETVRGDWTE